MANPQNTLYILLIALAAVGALRVSIRTSHMSVLRDQDVTIPCDIFDLNIGKAIAVLWKRRLENGTDHDVYEYNDGKVTVFRPGCYMETTKIPNGNADLHIPQVKFTDEGEYFCTVINTPDKVESRGTLDVSATPSADVTPVHPSIEEGTEKTVMCDVRNFYPKDVSIRWGQYRSGSAECELLEIWTCVKKMLENSDGTYNVTSLLTLTPKKEDNGNTYSCIVSHRSLATELSKNLTLTVTEKEDNTGTIIMAVLLTILIAGFVASFVFLYLKFIKKAPPTLSEITGNKELIDMNRTTLTCQIMDFRPNDIEISVCIRRSGKEMMTIYTWRSEGSFAPVKTSRGDGEEARVRIDVEQGRPLMNGSAGHDDRPLHLEMEPFITKKNLGTVSCQCSLHITPSYDLDNGAELSIHVKHPALTPSTSECKILNVVGVSPKLLSILGPEPAIHDEHVTLICPINGFKPRALSIAWLKRDENQQETELVTWNSGGQTTLNGRYSHNLKENDHDDKSYSFISALTMKANLTEDEGVIYICRTFHPATHHLEEKEMTMRVAAVPVLDAIEKETICVGEKLELCCRIHSFYPAAIEVKWYTEDGVELLSRTTDPLFEHVRLCHVNSKSEYTPQMKDLGKKIRCEVKHESLSMPKHICWAPNEFVSLPTLDDIQCVSEEPQPGKPVTFSCRISDMYPTDPTIQWYLGLNKYKSDQWKDNFQQDPKSKSFSGTTELTFTPEIKDYGSLIRLEIVHSGKTYTKVYLLSKKGILGLSEIVSDPIAPDYGRPVTLRCDVTDCNPGDISEFKWSEKGEQRQVPGSGNILSCYLTITPTARDYGHFITCSVTQKGIKEPFVRKILLKLPDRVPRLSDIIVHPARVTANQKATFEVIISGFSPKELKIKWYKEFGTFAQSDVTISEPEIGPDSLYTCSSMLTYTPRKGEKISIRCEVTHSQSKTLREKRYNLDLSGDGKEISEPPKTEPEKKFHIREITCAPEIPRVGEEVTLVAYVEECQVDSTEFTWCSGMFPVDGKIENKQDGSGCTSTITFKPKESDKDCTIKLEVFYNYQTVEEHYTLRRV
ncbi:uncharacterized protein ACMZJ9_016873 [Mantella aurantiaca]